MADYGIDINVNMGGTGNSFQSLIDSINTLNTNMQKFGTAAKNANSSSKQSFSESMNIIKKYGGTLETATQAIEKHRQKIKQLNDAIKLGSIEQRQYNARVNSSYDAIRRIETAQKQYNAALNQTSQNLNKVKTSSLNTTKVLNQLGAAFGITASIYGAVTALKYVVKTFSEFELSQKKLQSILGTTWSGMEDIRKSAINIGSSSIFGAKGVTELQIELAKMGFAKQDIIDMQQAIVNLATATQEDLASSAEVVANVIRTFELSAKDAAMVTDIMGQAFNDSALDLANFREAIKYVAPIANQANFSFAETVALLEQLSNAGIKGSLAGTGLTNIISRLGNENSKLTKQLGRTINGFDEFTAALFELKSSGADLQDSFDIVDRRAVAAFTVLMEGTRTVEEFRQKLIEASGVIEKQASVQMESLTYQTKQLKNEFDSLILRTEEGTNVLSYIFKTAITEMRGFFEVMSGGQRNLVGENIGKTLSELKSINQKVKEENKDLFKELSAANLKIMWGHMFNIKKLTEDGLTELKDINSRILKESEKMQTYISESAKRIMQKTLDTVSPELYNNIIARMNLQLNKLKEGSQAYEELAARIKILSDAEEEYNSGKDLANTNEKERISLLKKSLELDKQIAIEGVKLKYNGDEEKRRIAQTTYYWDKRIAEETIEDETEKQKTLTLLGIKLANELKDIKTKYAIDLLKIEENIQQTRIKAMYDGYEEERKLLDSNYEYGLKILEKEAEGDANKSKKILEYKEKYLLESEDLDRKHRIDVLNAQKELSELEIQIQFEGYEETVKLREDGLKKEIEILNERDLATEEHNTEYLKIMAKYNLAVVDETKKFQDELTKLTYEGELTRLKLEGDSYNNKKASIDAWYNYELSTYDKSAKNYDQMVKNLGAERDLKLQELAQGQSIWEMLFSKASDKQIAAMQQSLGLITDSISQVVDGWVDSTEKIVDLLNRQIDETQSALEVEAELMAAGYANNVTLKKKELEELKRQRREAFEDQKKAQMAQLHMESALQVAGLISTAVNVFNAESKKGILGIGLAIAGIATIFGMMAKYRALAKEQSVMQFAKGGWIDGKRHSEGGTLIEAEKGEFVVNRNASAKHKTLIEAINKDDQYQLNRIYLNNLKGQIISAKVSLDDSKDLKAIRKLMEQQGKSVEYSGGYRVERIGNVTTKIRLN